MGKCCKKETLTTTPTPPRRDVPGAHHAMVPGGAWASCKDSLVPWDSVIVTTSWSRKRCNNFPHFRLWRTASLAKSACAFHVQMEKSPRNGCSATSDCGTGGRVLGAAGLGPSTNVGGETPNARRTRAR
eukprot:7598658-Pyramimonas_sp.AAC.3